MYYKVPEFKQHLHLTTKSGSLQAQKSELTQG